MNKNSLLQMTNTSKKKCMGFLCSFIVISIIIVSVNFILDPFQIYHKTYFGEGFFSNNARYQNAGIINTYINPKSSELDTVLIGTSLSLNFDCTYVDEKMKVKSVNLPMEGSYPLEKRIVLEKALKCGKITKVIWEIGGNYRSKNVNESHRNHKFPFYLYDTNIFNDYKYLYNYESSLEFAWILKKTWNKKRSLKKLYYVMDEWNEQGAFEKHNSKQNLKHIKTNVIESRKLRGLYKLKSKSSFFPSLDENLIKIVNQHPSVEFDIYFPPYPSVFYAMDSHNSLNDLFSMRRYLVETISKKKNVRIFAFDDMTQVTGNLHYYMNTHYSSEVNAMIIDWMVDGSGELTPYNITEYEIRLQNIINNCQVYSDFES